MMHSVAREIHHNALGAVMTTAKVQIKQGIRLLSMDEIRRGKGTGGRKITPGNGKLTSSDMSHFVSLRISLVSTRICRKWPENVHLFESHTHHRRGCKEWCGTRSNNVDRMKTTELKPIAATRIDILFAKSC